MEPSVIIRPAGPSDAPELLAVYAPYVRDTAISFEYTVPTPEEFRRRVEKTLERYPYFAAEREGQVLGYCYAGPFIPRAAYDWCAEVSIYLDPAWTGRGLGKALYQRMEQALLTMGICSMYACIGVPEAPDRYLTRNSAEFHSHMGFRQVGFFKNCGRKFDTWYHMIWMEKTLQTPAAPAPVRPWPEVKPEGGDGICSISTTNCV